MGNTSEIRNGLCINHSNDTYSVVQFQHVKPGKGAAFVRTKIKSLTNGKVIDVTFSAGHKIDIVRVERRKYQYLYKDIRGFNFMDNETYEQVAIGEEMISNAGFMKEGSDIEVLMHADENRPLTVDLPQYVELEVTYTEPGVKGNTATNATKPATLETGATVNVPLFINEGDFLKVDTSNGNYVERVKK